MSQTSPTGLDVVALCQELVAIESVTLREGPVVQHLVERLVQAALHRNSPLRGSLRLAVGRQRSLGRAAT